MSDIDLEEKVFGVDWSKYKGSEYYRPAEVVESLIHLIRNDTSKARHGLDNKVLFAVGNNHAGTFYPAILEVADILIKIEQEASIEAVRKCAYAILNDLYYFEADVENYSAHTREEIESFVQSKLANYADKT